MSSATSLFGVSCHPRYSMNKSPRCLSGPHDVGELYSSSKVDTPCRSRNTSILPRNGVLVLILSQSNPLRRPIRQKLLGEVHSPNKKSRPKCCQNVSNLSSKTIVLYTAATPLLLLLYLVSASTKHIPDNVFCQPAMDLIKSLPCQIALSSMPASTVKHPHICPALYQYNL